MIGDRKISIVTAYYNRRKLFYNTLKTIEQSKYKDLVEIVVVDDNSNDNNRIDDFPNLFKLDIKVIRIEVKDKWWTNPCIPFNIAFKAAQNDIIIIQNPECMHFGEIIEYTLNNIKDNMYLSFGAYSVDNYNQERINKVNFDSPSMKNQIGKIISPLRDGPLLADGTNAWYNHSKWRPLMLHFCNAIMKKDLDDLGGFDERFGAGFAWDDNELIWRIKNIKKMNCVIADRPFVIHQFHGTSNYGNNQLLFAKNAELYNLVKSQQNYKANQ
jgi:glycosyltransferase involved in cell wall biosynthesis